MMTKHLKAQELLATSVKDCCGNCTAFLFDGEVCRAKPPVPIMLGFGQPTLAIGPQQAQPVIHSYFPHMNPTEGWCREHVRKKGGGP